MATPTEWLNEFQVNTGAAEDNFQFSPDIIGLSNGNFLVAWIEADNLAIPESIDIIAKIYDPQGNVVRNAFQLNTTTFDTGGRAGGFDIASTNDGGFILVYEDNNTDVTTESAVRWERFDSIGNSTGHVAQIALENSSENFLQSPQLAVDLTDNSSVVTFTEIIGDNYDIRGRHLSATGNLLYNEFDAAQNSNDFDGTGDVAILSTGDYVSVYQERDGGIPGIEFRIFEPDGSVVGNNFTNVSDGINPQVASLTGGDFVITWQNDDDIHYRIYDNVGDAQTGVLTAQATQDSEITPEVVALQDGDFVIVWDNQTEDTLQARRFNADGSTEGNLFTVENSMTARPNIGVSGDGRILFTWMTDSIDAEIFASVWDPRSSIINAITYDVNRTNFVRSTVITSRTTSSIVNGDSSSETILGQNVNGLQLNETVIGSSPIGIIDNVIDHHPNNVIGGQRWNDILTGAGGNDTVLGGFGADILNGSNDKLIGRGEIDIIDPGDYGAKDVIILGNSDSLYYSDPALEDHAVILNFDRLSFAGETDSDIIEIRDTPDLALSPYNGRVSGISITNGTRIHAGREDIAFVDSNGLLTFADLAIL